MWTASGANESENASPFAVIERPSPYTPSVRPPRPETSTVALAGAYVGFTAKT